MNSFKNQEPDFQWPHTPEPTGEASNLSNGSSLAENVVSITKSIISTTNTILTENKNESFSEAPGFETTTKNFINTMLNLRKNTDEFINSTSTEATTLSMGSTVDSMNNIITEVVPQKNLVSTLEDIMEILTKTSRAATTEEPANLTTETFKYMFTSVTSPQKPLLGSVNTEKPLNSYEVTEYDTIKNIFKDISTENTFVVSANTVTDESSDNTYMKSTVKTIRDWLTNVPTEKSLLDSDTMKNSLETTVTESPTLQLSTNKTLKVLFESTFATEKPLLEQVISKDKTLIEFNNKTELMKDMYTTFTTTPMISDATTTKPPGFSTVEIIKDMQKPMYDLGNTTSYTTTAGETVTEIFSTISSNITSGNNKESSSLLDMDRDIIIYILLGVILVVLIVIFIGIYLCCGKCKGEHEITGEYYVSQLKDYSESSTKSPETTSDTMINIKM